MKILFLHLSDAHLKENTDLRDININAMVKSLSQMETFDECVLVFSGDITNSGEYNEFTKAVYLVRDLINGIKSKYMAAEKHIITLFVPGNHDSLIKDLDRNHTMLKQYYEKKLLDDKLNDELAHLHNFYGFAKRNLCFVSEKIIHVRKLVFNQFVIKANLINSAPFSLLGGANEDKGLHYLPKGEFRKFDFDYNENYTISILHHGPEWFSDEAKNKLYEKMYETSNLIFVGHEHFSLSENKTVNNKYKIDISSGVALYGTKTEHGFNAIILNVEQSSLRGHKYIYNGSIYKPTPNLTNENLVFRGRFKFTCTNKFKEFLEKDINDRAGDNYLKYFVFPSLEAKDIIGDLKNFGISTKERFIELLRTENKIYIESGPKYGKSILSKFLCSTLLENYLPIYLNCENFSIKDNNKVLKYALTTQFGETADYDQFIQVDKIHKVLIVDDYDNVDRLRWDSFLEECNEIFGHMILFCDTNWSFNIKEKALQELSENHVLHLKICPFYYSKREQFIRKICMNFQEYRLADIDEKVRKINDEITKQIKFFQLTPEFIHQFVYYYLTFSHMKTQQESNVFSKVFEANITFRLAKNTSEENIDETMVALDFVAYYIHSNERYPLSLEEFELAINNYNNKYDNQLNPKIVYDVAIKSNIINEIPDKFGIEFCDRNLLAYFTALHLNRVINENDGTDDLEEFNDLNNILNNICFGINGDIILFLSYITSNVRILVPIMQSIVMHMEKWEELDIDKGNIKIFSAITTSISTVLPTAKDKEKNAIEKENIEREIIENTNNDAESLYSYDKSKINSFSNKILKSIHYLELVAKILPNFRHILKGEQKREIVDKLYTYPNKLLFFMLKDIDENRAEIVKEILDMEIHTKKGKLITKDMIEKELQNQAIVYTLCIYDFIADLASTGKTIIDLNKFDYEKNSNYMLQNIMMEEQAGSFKEFTAKAEKFYDNSDDNVIKSMIRLIVRKYFMSRTLNIVGDVQRIAHKFLGDGEMKSLQIAQTKNRIIKK